MPIPTVTCSICGQTVNKKQTYSVGDGKRACKVHEGVQEKSTALQEEEKAKKVAESEHRRHRHVPQMTNPLLPRCWICHQEGLRQDEFFLRYLVDIKKAELQTGKTINIFNPAEVQEAVKSLQGFKCLWFVEWKNGNAKIKVPYQTYQTIKLSEQIMGQGLLLVCSDCCHAKGFKTLSEERLTNITLEKATLLGAIADQVITSQAQKELASETVLQG